MEWKRTMAGSYESACGRFKIFRRSRERWVLWDESMQDSSGHPSLRSAKRTAEWRVRDERKGKPLIEVLD